MTLGIAWIRSKNNRTELIVASDSRLSGGQFWDSNPKILTMPRSDCVLSFAGLTDSAYPLMITASYAVSMSPKVRDRGFDLCKLKTHIVEILNSSRAQIHNLPVGQAHPSHPNADFILSGYSWKKKDFRIWTIHYDSSILKYTSRPTANWRGQSKSTKKRICFVGDGSVVSAAKAELLKLLKRRGKLQAGNFDMEPFEVMRDLIRSNVHSSVGGAPQMVRIYEHMTVQPIAVHWPSKINGAPTIFGRPIEKHEAIECLTIDPDSPSL